MPEPDSPPTPVNRTPIGPGPETHGGRREPADATLPSRDAPERAPAVERNESGEGSTEDPQASPAPRPHERHAE